MQKNALAAASLALSQGVEPRAIHAGLERCHQLPGRFDVLSETPRVVLDYAHTPDALARVCDTARQLARDQRLIVVFGAAGGFDSPKRPAMGEAVGARADIAFVTNENPRNEDPSLIIEAVASGCRRANRARTVLVANRREAIRSAIECARPGDVVLITGRGRDEGLLTRDGVIPYSDVTVVRELLEV